MTDEYQISQGHDNAGSLQTMVPQPHMTGLEWGSREIAGDMLMKLDGFKRGHLVFDYMSKAQRIAFETQAGLSEGVESALVTVRIPRNSDRAFTNFNATIVAPAMPDEAAFASGKYVPIDFVLEGLIEI